MGYASFGVLFATPSKATCNTTVDPVLQGLQSALDEITQWGPLVMGVTLRVFFEPTST